MGRKDPGGQLRQEIGLFGGVSLVAGMTVGSGIYYLCSLVLERTHLQAGMALLCWVIGGGVSLLGGLCFAELGAALPVTGGITAYLSRAYHPAVGFVSGFCTFLLIGSGSTAALALACITGFQEVFAFTPLQAKLLAVGIILLFTAVNLLGVKGAARVQGATTLIRMIPLGLVILLGLFLGRERPDLALPVPAAAGEFSSFLRQITFAVFASLWAYEGWNNLNAVAEEMKHPRRDLPRAILFSMGGITLLYTLFNLAVCRVLPAEEITQLIDTGRLYLGNEAAARLLGEGGRWVVLLGMTVGILGTVNGNVLVFPRMYYALARDGCFPAAFARLSRRGVPVAATLASSAMSVLLVLANTLRGLTDLLVLISGLMNLLAILSVLVLRVREPALARPYRVWGGVPTILITVLLFSFLLVNEIWRSPRDALVSLVILLAALVAYYGTRARAGGGAQRP